MVAEFAPLQLRRTVFIPPPLRPEALSVIPTGVGVGVWHRPGLSAVSPAAVEEHLGLVIVSAPHDHFAAGPHREVCCLKTGSRKGRVGDAGGCPTVGAGIISAA